MKTALPYLAMICLAAPAMAEPGERVTEIRKWYETVQKAKHTAERKIAFEASSEPMSGDVVLRDYDDGWKTVTASYGAGDHAVIDEHYYYKNGKLFFAYVITTYWQFHPDSTDEKPKTIDTRTEDRYYYDDKGETCVRRLTRSATTEAGGKLTEAVGKKEQKEIDPGDEAKDHRKEALKLLEAKKSADVLAAYGVE
ncbi:hypothetical protein OKA04_20480 [Luteolibacter flavescens]|uniref:Lipoprotein n=1 Tax=Luteolibacter flavescens TaxID=1859460 RepID=A0ABT3FU69_9BACT|nr:hypothetical protein [Luteolibacter flavescens]MCW1887127.1 hypothetical protein [Luteolibacter flavescens]